MFLESLCEQCEAISYIVSFNEEVQCAIDVYYLASSLPNTDFFPSQSVQGAKPDFRTFPYFI